jgi:bleomycin hydrolase
LVCKRETRERTDPHTDKYGIIPASLYPESFSSSSSSRMCWLLTAKLREYTIVLRKASRPAGDETAATAEELQALKIGFMREIYATLCITLGTPPKPDDKVTWEYYDKDNTFHSWTGTPLQYYSEFCERKDMAPKDSFSLINDPRNEYGRLYTVRRLGNVWGGPRVRCELWHPD